MPAIMEPLIDVINKLQDVFSTTGSEAVKLPQIVVIGSQSSGKSSVLESIVGHSFLPRGSGTVTRCPIVLQLIHIPDETDAGWCEFLHKPGEQFDFDQVEEEILIQTERLAGSNKGICYDEISLKVYSPRVIQLTLVDLPGMVKVPTGDQPVDIESLIKDLYMKYIKNPNSIILAVSSAGNDMATSESLKIAKKIDPEGIRTLAIVTKLDLMDFRPDANDVLTGRTIPVRLGIIGVVNRSQQDIIDQKSIQQALEDEAEFMQQNYPNLAATNGTPFLARKLNKLLMEHIKTCLPELETRINLLLGKSRSDIESLGTTISVGQEGTEVLRILTIFAENYKASIDGSTRHLDTKYIPGSVQIAHVFEQVFSKELEDISPIENLTKEDILIAIRRSGGVESKFIIPEAAFRDLVKTQIKRLEGPALNCASYIDIEMKKVIDTTVLQLEIEMLRFPRLKNAIVSHVEDILRRRLAEVQVMLKTYVQVEASFVSTRQKDFNIYEEAALNGSDLVGTRIGNDQIDTSGINGSINGELTNRDTPGVAGTNGKLVSRSINDKQMDQCLKVESLMTSYFKIVREMFMDHVPKAIMYTTVYFVADNILIELISNLYDNNETVGKLLAESDEIHERRQQSETLLQALERASELIAEVRVSPV